MNEEKRFSDEFLNAFVDDQLAAEEKGRAYLDIGRDEVLNRQVCELRKLHELVQLAYRNPPAPPARVHAGGRARRSNLGFGIAASFLLVLGALIGAQLELLAPTRAPETLSVAPAATASQNTMAARTKTAAQTPAVAPATMSAYGNSSSKVLIHIARDDAQQLREALDEVESLLRHYRDSRQDARVEVVINGKGLELVRVDTSAFADRISQLQREFDNLTFAACQNTIDRLKREQGIIVRLLPGVVVIDSGMAELMRRQNQGWTYIQV
jgi:intracellular sulfur oxidation DsrE/DsrF family protein